MLSDWIRRKAELNGSRIAVEHLGRDVRTYAELDQNAGALAAGYASLGLGHATHAARLMANSLANIDTWFGMIRGRAGDYCRLGLVMVMWSQTEP
jgi:non-ribosomal peptide synthetase component E (peptide arylation enzyme)